MSDVSTISNRARDFPGARSRAKSRMKSAENDGKPIQMITGKTYHRRSLNHNLTPPDLWSEGFTVLVFGTYHRPSLNYNLTSPGVWSKGSTVLVAGLWFVIMQKLEPEASDDYCGPLGPDTRRG